MYLWFGAGKRNTLPPQTSTPRVLQWGGGQFYECTKLTTTQTSEPPLREFVQTELQTVTR